ncbi:MAG: flagellar biosynthesis protein FlhB [Hyphomicrobiaceae bacterium]
MSENASQDQKTEEPTEKKIADALKDGNTPFSRETVAFGSIMGMLAALTFFVPAAMERLTQVLKRLIEDPGGWQLNVSNDASGLMDFVMVEAAWSIAPIISILLCAGLFAALVQNTPRLVLKRITPQASRLSLGKGWKRLFGQQGLVEFLKSVFKFSAATAATYITLRAMSWDVWNTMLTHPGNLPNTIFAILISAISALAVASLVLAIADLSWTRYHWYQQQRMTKEEVKKEHKQAEGDPLLKSRIRSIARDRARKRMISRVPEATVVIVNPTHYAVALRYELDVDAAPIVIAKGQDLIALKIRETAESHGIAVVEDKDLARPLYHSVEVDQIIPHEFYQAVAQIIIYLNNKSRH